MKKILLSAFGLMLYLTSLNAQTENEYTLKAGLVLQQTQYLYNENGVGVDFSSAKILNNKVHFNANYLTSRLGSAIGSNALKQDYYILGADYHFFSDKKIQLLAGLNTGLFVVDYEDALFADLPSSSLLLSVETGLNYDFQKIPLSASLSVGYNLRNGNGIDIPGSLFPVFYKLGVMYRIDNLFTK